MNVQDISSGDKIIISVKTKKLNHRNFEGVVYKCADEYIDIEALQYDNKLLGFNSPGLSLTLKYTIGEGTIREYKIDHIDLIKVESIGQVCHRVYISKSGFKNTRGAKRFLLDGKGTLQVGKNTQPYIIEVIDISASGTGVRCYSDKVPSFKDKVCTVSYSTRVDGYTYHLRVAGKVVRVTAAGDNVFTVGIKFDHESKIVNDIVMAIQRLELSKLTHNIITNVKK